MTNQILAAELEQLKRMIDGWKIPFGTELAMQDTLQRILKSANIKYHREFVFGPRDRIDFLVGRIGIECKVAGSTGAVMRQLLRYAERPEIGALILVTSRHTHRFSQTEIGGKPFKVIRIINL